MSGKGRRQVVAAKPLQAPKSVKSFGIGTTKIGSAEKKRLLISALMEKRANPAKALWSLGTKAVKHAPKAAKDFFNYMAPKTIKPTKTVKQAVDVPKPLNTAVTGRVAPSKWAGFKKGLSEGSNVKSVRGQGAANRLVTKTQRAEVDTINKLNNTSFPGGQPRLIPKSNTVPSARNMPSGLRPTAAPTGVPKRLQTARTDYRNSASNLARNELAQTAGRVIAKPLGVARDIGKGVRNNAGPVAWKATKATGLAAGAAAGAGGGFHLYKNRGTDGIVNTMGAGVKDLYGAVKNPLDFGVSNTMKAVQAPHKLTKVKNPANLTQAQLGANNITPETVALARESRGNLTDARNMMRLRNSSKTLDDNWQLVDKGAKVRARPGEAVDANGFVMSKERAADQKRIMARVKRIKAARKRQDALDSALQSSGK
jgi:hypothetical protein